MGYKNVKVLGGGVEGWKNAGYPMAETIIAQSSDEIGRDEVRPSDIT